MPTADVVKGQFANRQLPISNLPIDNTGCNGYGSGMKLDIEEQLRRAIRDSPENQRTIALGAGVNVGMLSRFMRGERSISLGTAAKIAAYLKLSLKR